MGCHDLEVARSNFTLSELSMPCSLLLAFVTLLSSAHVAVSLLLQEGLCSCCWLSRMAVVVHKLIASRSQDNSLQQILQDVGTGALESVCEPRRNRRSPTSNQSRASRVLTCRCCACTFKRPEDRPTSLRLLFTRYDVGTCSLEPEPAKIEFDKAPLQSP